MMYPPMDVNGSRGIALVLKYWQRNNVRLLPARHHAGVVAALIETGRLVSRDVVDLYCATGGMENGESDPHLFSLWDLDLLIAENRNDRDTDLLFADFLINSHCYRFRYESVERSSVWIDHFGSSESELVAPSVDAFFTLLVDDPDRAGLYTGR